MRPGKTFFIAAFCYLFLGAAAFFSETLSVIWLIAGVCMVPFIVTDAVILLLFTDRLSVERKFFSSVAQGEKTMVTLFISRGERPLLPFGILLWDLHPPSMETDAFPAFLCRKKFKEGKSISFTYSLIPKERGTWIFSGAGLLLNSPLRFWRFRVLHRCVSKGRTYPDFKHIIRGSGDLRGFMDKTGSREIRRRGQGLEFRDLRDYQDGDPVKAIDWRATSRNMRLDGNLKLIVREYQEEQDQQILFILDSGYRLPPSQFDSALESVLLLAWAALKRGDAAAAMAFGAQDRWVPPGKGMSAFTRLMNSLYDLECAPLPSSPSAALEKALARLKRRTFIVLISNFREEDGESLSWILPRIKGSHLLLLVSFREKEAEKLGRGLDPADSSRGEQNSTGAILETAAAFSYLASRRRLYRSWEHMGFLTLETTPEKISSELINKYLSLKRSGRL
jgi:uncharacterized protein (DUF58 family)